MTETPAKGPAIQVKPQPDIYSLLLIVVTVALAVTLVIVMHNLLSPVVRPDGTPGGYGLSFQELFGSLKNVIPGD
jgi:hypothetical protein